MENNANLTKLRKSIKDQSNLLKTGSTLRSCKFDMNKLIDADLTKDTALKGWMSAAAAAHRKVMFFHFTKLCVINIDRRLAFAQVEAAEKAEEAPTPEPEKAERAPLLFNTGRHYGPDKQPIEAREYGKAYEDLDWFADMPDAEQYIIFEDKARGIFGKIEMCKLDKDVIMRHYDTGQYTDVCGFEPEEEAAVPEGQWTPTEDQRSALSARSADITLHGREIVLTGNTARIMALDGGDIESTLQADNAGDLIYKIHEWFAARGPAPCQNAYHIGPYGGGMAISETTNDSTNGRILLTFSTASGLQEGPGLGAEADSLVAAVPEAVIRKMVNDGLAGSGSYVKFLCDEILGVIRRRTVLDGPDAWHRVIDVEDDFLARNPKRTDKEFTVALFRLYGAATLEAEGQLDRVRINAQEVK